MDTCSAISRRHESDECVVSDCKTERQTSDEAILHEASAANTPSSRWFHTSTSSGRKFKFRRRFADEGLESFMSSDSDGESPKRSFSNEVFSRSSDGCASARQPDLSLTCLGPNERITNMKTKDLCNARPRE